MLGGFGLLAGEILCVGLTGDSSQRQHVLLLLGALETCLERDGGIRAAESVYSG